LGIAHRVTNDLRERIVEGLLRPGAPLREDALTAEFGVSRNTLRESIRLLAAEGLVVQRLHKGAVVAVVGESDVRDIFTVRRAIELRAVDESSFATREMLRSIDAAASATETAFQAGDWQKAGTCSLRFHQSIVELLGSDRLNDFFRTMVAQLRLAYSLALVEADFHAEWVPRDREICDLLVSGRRSEASSALKIYLEDSERHVLDVVRASVVRDRGLSPLSSA